MGGMAPMQPGLGGIQGGMAPGSFTLPTGMGAPRMPATSMCKYKGLQLKCRFFCVGGGGLEDWGSLFGKNLTNFPTPPIWQLSSFVDQSLSPYLRFVLENLKKLAQFYINFDNI